MTESVGEGAEQLLGKLIFGRREPDKRVSQCAIPGELAASAEDAAQVGEVAGWDVRNLTDSADEAPRTQSCATPLRVSGRLGNGRPIGDLLWRRYEPTFLSRASAQWRVACVRSGSGPLSA